MKKGSNDRKNKYIVPMIPFICLAVIGVAADNRCIAQIAGIICGVLLGRYLL